MKWVAIIVAKNHRKNERKQQENIQSMKTNCKRVDLLITAGLNIIFFIAFVFVIGVKYETNDDLALSLLVEGAYGDRTPYMIYSNVLWGELLVGLYTLVPAIKWYLVVMFFMLFVAHSVTTYINIRLQGRRVGLVTSTLMLLFLGYCSYSMFQYSRIAPVVTASGLLLLFYAIEYAEKKCEKTICLVVGTIMVVWSSLIRFQMFALAVVLAGGAIGVYKVWQIFIEKKKDWLKQICVYVAVFGTVGALSLVCLVIDKMYYTSDGWQYYQEFNQIRTELWDYGFPDYASNEKVYNSVGIDEQEFAYYLDWNMDEEYMTMECLNTIADAKPDKSFDLFGFLSAFPKRYFIISVFILFLIISIIAFAINWKNIYFILFEGLAVMTFEAYFYYIGRYGIARIDNAMWMVASIVIMYVISSSGKLEERWNVTWKNVVLSIGAIGVLFIADFVRVPLIYEGDTGSSKAFFEEIALDDEHLYIMTSEAPKPYYAFDFWEPSQLGELSNIYNLYGWEFNHETKKAVLTEYGITNVYKDALNNESVYFVAQDQRESLQTYIQANYDANAYLETVRVVDGVEVLRLCSN